VEAGSARGRLTGAGGVAAGERTVKTKERDGGVAPDRDDAADQGGPRRRILDAALDIVEAEGIAALTQPKVAKAAGLRQSHITYYFPRKADLVVALLEASHLRAAEGGSRSDRSGDVFSTLSGLMFDRRRMLFFLGILMAVSDDAALGEIFRAHADGLAAQVSGVFGVPPDDPALMAFIDELRGAGLRLLIAGSAATPDVAAIAARHGLRPRSSGVSARQRPRARTARATKS
jgi:AcrR family transcriptional regulator